MDTDRIYRLSVAGWGSILFWAVHSWALGADPLELLKATDPRAIAYVLVGLAGGPILGFMVSAFVEVIRNHCYPEFMIPPWHKFKKFRDALENLSTESAKIEIYGIVARVDSRNRCSRRKYGRKLVPYVNLLIHSRAKEPFLEYGARRWTMHRMYANSIGAFFLAAVVALFTSGKWWKLRIFCDLLWCDPRFYIEILLALFVGFGLFLLNRVYCEIHEIVWAWILSEADKVGK